MRVFIGYSLLALLLVVPSLATGSTWHVPSEAPTIQAGIDSAAVGDTVLVECGTYYEHDITMKSGITLRSQTGDPSCVTIDAQRLGRILYCSDIDSTTVIRGVTFARGKVSGGVGGGMYCTRSSPKILKCIFDENRESHDGGAIFCTEGSSPTITGCTFAKNHAFYYGGCIYCIASSPVLRDCSLGLDISAGAHLGGAIACRNGSSLVMINCLCIDLYARYGACIYLWDSSGTFDHCTFTHPHGDVWHGGVMYVRNSSPILRNCTLAGNYAHTGAGLCCLSSSSPALDNCIIALNTEGQAVYCDATSTAGLSCCDIYGNAGGDWVGCIAAQYGLNGNISEDPLFCDAGSEDFTLRADSPCAPFSPPNEECDLIGAWGVCCPTVLALSPPKVATYYPCGGSFPLDLVARDVCDLGAFELCTGYDNATVDLTAVAIGTFLGSTGRSVYPLAPIYCTPSCQAAGLRYGAYSAGDVPGPSGRGVLARISLARSGDGAASDSLCVEDWELVNSGVPPALIDVAEVSGAELAHRAFCYGDFNDDADVTVVDIMQVASRWGCCVGEGCYTDTFDVNLLDEDNYCASVEDGCIDVVDVQTVAGRWGLGCPGEAPDGEPPGEPPETAPLVRVWPDSFALCCGPGDTSSFAIVIDDACDLGAFEAHLSFDPSVVHVEDVIVAGFLGSTGRSPYPLGPKIQNESGTADFGGWTIGSTPGPSGYGILARVVVSIQSCQGGSALDLTDVTITNTRGWPASLRGISDGWVRADCWTGAPEDAPPLPTSYALYPGMPNPLNRSTTLTFAIPAGTGGTVPVELAIYSVAGRVVRQLVDRECGPGYHKAAWDGNDGQGHPVASGIYFCRLRAGEDIETRRLVVVR